MAGGSADMGARGAPAWVTTVLLPLVNLTAALLVSGLVILAIGEDPIRAMGILVRGAVGYPEAIGFTLYYATNFIFTGLAVAVAFHCGLFNIGGEGQAYIGGLGVGLAMLALDWMPWWAVLPFAIAASMLAGAAWAAIPAYLQAKRGSHIVITTIMFNFIAATLMVYLLVNVLNQPGSMSPETRRFAPDATLPLMSEVFGWIGISLPRSPVNLSFVIALIAGLAVYVFIWRTRWGYEIRAVGRNQSAALYAGISPARTIVVAMLISGALAGMMALNEIMAANERVILNFTAGYGFVGIAVALMGRNHPVGIVLAALLFGALYQGGADLAFEIPAISREMVVVIQGLVILFAGALEYMFRPYLLALFDPRRRRPAPAAE